MSRKEVKFVGRLMVLLSLTLGLTVTIATLGNVSTTTLTQSCHWTGFQSSKNTVSSSVSSDIDVVSDNCYTITATGLGFSVISGVNTPKGKQVWIGGSFPPLLVALLFTSMKKAKQTATRKARYTTYISKRHLEILNEISERTGRPISSLIGEALDYFLNEKLGLLEGPEEPPVDPSYYREKMKEKANS